MLAKKSRGLYYKRKKNNNFIVLDGENIGKHFVVFFMHLTYK